MIVSCSLVFVCSLFRQGGEGESMSGGVSSFLDTMVSTSRGGIHSSIHSYINLMNSGADEVTDQVLLYKPKFNPWSPHQGGRREPTLRNYRLTSTCAPWHLSPAVYAHTYAMLIINF